MKHILSLLTVTLCVGSIYSQLQPVTVNIQHTIHTNANQNFNRTVTCGNDTVLYPLGKATGFRALNINNATSARGCSQYYNAPQPITIYGVEFFAYKLDLTGGSTLTPTVEIYLAAPDSMPTGAPLASTTLVIDTTFGSGGLNNLRKVAMFTTPITVSAPYVVVVDNNTANGMGIISNDYGAVPPDGGTEYLASLNLFGNWTRSYQVNVGGLPFDADWLFHPIVSYNLTADFIKNPNCLSSGLMTLTNNSSPIVGDRMYNQAAFLGVPEISYTWDFGDGSPLVNAVDTSHNYLTGPFNITLTDTIFGWNTTCTTDTIKVTLLDITAGFTSATSQLVVNFTDTTVNQDTSATWLWDFGDGNNSSLQNPSHTYAMDGTYTVCLIATNNCTSDTSCTTISVCTAGTAQFSNSPTGLTVAFTNSSSGVGTHTWFWDFGDGNNSNQQSPSHTYASDGTYTVCLIMTDSCGTDTTCQSITVSAPTTGIDNIETASFNLYPNPAQHMVTLDFGNLKEIVNYIEVTDISGRRVLYQKVGNHTSQIQLSLNGIATGTYTITAIRNDGNKSSRLLIIQK